MSDAKRHRPFFTVALFSLVACATHPEQEYAVARNDAIDDYIKVADLPETDQIRIKHRLHHQVITERYIIIYDDRDAYLATFKPRCRELTNPKIEPDFRHESRKLRARFDTYRGCKIISLHEVTSGQAEELLGLGSEG